MSSRPSRRGPAKKEKKSQQHVQSGIDRPCCRKSSSSRGGSRSSSNSGGRSSITASSRSSSISRGRGNVSGCSSISGGGRVRCCRRRARACRVMPRRFVVASTRTRRVSAFSSCPPSSAAAHVRRSTFPLAAPCSCPRFRPAHVPTVVASPACVLRAQELGLRAR